MRPTRILVISHMYPRINNPISGIFIHEQNQALRRKGVEVTVISPVPYVPRPAQNTESRRGYRRLRRACLLDGIPVHYPRYACLPWPWAYGFSSLALAPGIRGLARVLAYCQGMDLIHAHCATPDGLAAVRLGAELGLPVLCSLRGSDIHEYPYESPLTYRLTREALHRAGRVVAVSAALARQAREIAGAGRPVGIIPNGCDAEAFAPRPESRAAARRGLGVGAGDILLLFVGALARSKGVFELAAAFARLARSRRDLRLALVGDGQQRGELERALRSAGVADRASLLDPVAHDRMPAFFNAADIFVLPTYAEGFPNVVKEAMACAAAVVTTAVGGIPEAVQDGANGLLVPPRDEAALEAALARLIDDAALRRRLGEGGRATVRERYSWDASAQLLLAEYAGLIGVRQGAS